MSKQLTIFITDDNDLHAKLLSNEIIDYTTKKSMPAPELIHFENGNDVIGGHEGKTPHLITLDINMPVMDGLSALVKLQKKYPSTPIMMVSSEDIHKVGRLTKKDLSGLSPEEKQGLLNKVVDRVKENQEEEGKINSILEAVSSLHMDPIAVARDLGAAAYVHKPFSREEVEERLNRLLK